MVNVSLQTEGLPLSRLLDYPYLSVVLRAKPMALSLQSLSNQILSFFHPIGRKALVPLCCTTTSPRDANCHLCSPQAKLAPFTCSPGKHLALVIHSHGMGPTTRHQHYLLSIQSSYQLCRKEQRVRLLQFHQKRTATHIKIDFRVQ